MNRKSNLKIFLLLIFSIIMLSISTTLALIRDEEIKVGNILKFDKVSIYADKFGSNLSYEVDTDCVGNGQVIYKQGSDKYESLKITPTSDTQDMYIRFKLSYTLNDFDLDEENEELLLQLNEENNLISSVTLNNSTANNYGFTYSNGWYYLVTEPTGIDQKLKVARSSDTDGFYIIESFQLIYDNAIENAIIELGERHQIYLKITAEAMQCFETKTEIELISSNSIMNSNEIDYEKWYGNKTIADYEERKRENQSAIFTQITMHFDPNIDNLRTVTNVANAVPFGSQDNIIISEGETTKLHVMSYAYYNSTTQKAYRLKGWSKTKYGGVNYIGDYTYEEIRKITNNRSEITFYGNWEEVAMTVRDYVSGESNGSRQFLGSTGSKYIRQNVAFVKFTDNMDEITKAYENKTYVTFDSGTIKGQITSYWITNGANYNVYVYQKNGVMFNASCYYMFSGISPSNKQTMATFDTTSWVITTSHVTSMDGMFNNCRIAYYTFGDNFDTSNVTNMCRMFHDNTAIKSLKFGKKFVSNKVTTMNAMFSWAGANGSVYDFGNFGLNRTSRIDLTEMFWSFASNTSKVYVHPNAYNWFNSIKHDYNYQLIKKSI